MTSNLGHRRFGDRCYQCGAPATSVEHVPPKVFFPEIKHVGEDVRKNLLTIPACKAHNEDYSQDDEYVAYAIVCGANHSDPIDGHHPIGMRHFNTKVIAALERSPRLAATVLKGLTPIKTPKGRAGAFTLDLDRFELSMKRIASGLWYHRTRVGVADFQNMVVVSPDLGFAETMTAPYEVMSTLVETSPGWKPLDTWDPRIFQCDFIDEPQRYFIQQNPFMLRMVFYQGFRVWVISDGSRLL